MQNNISPYEKEDINYQKPPNFIERLLSHFTYTQKFGIIISLITISTLLTSYLLFKAQKNEMHFINQELKGIQLQKGVRDAFEGIVKHKILSHRYLQGDEAIKQEIIDLQEGISKNLAELVDLNNEFEDELQLSDEDFKIREEEEIAPKQLLKQWEDFSSEAFEITPDISDAFHINLINNLRLLLKTVGDTSNLNLDSDLKTHYLNASVLDTLPEGQDAIAQILTLLYRITLENKATFDDEYRLTNLLTLYKNNLEKLKRDLNKALIDEKNHNNSLITAAAIIAAPLNSYIEGGNNFIQQVDQFLYALEKRKENQNELGLFPFSEGNIFGIKALNKSFLLLDALSQLALNSLEKRHEAIYNNFLRLIAFLIGLLSLALLIGSLVLRYLNNYLNGIYASTRQYRDGNLEARAPDAFDKSLQKFTNVLNELAVRYETLMDKLQSTGFELSKSTSKLSDAADYQKESVSQQEKAIQEMLETTGDISSTAKQFAKTTNELSRSAAGTASLASIGKRDLAKMEQTMRQMVEASFDINSKLAVLSEKTSSITSVITTITKVADQTNLLSLNAAIEAEKAGEHGKSFSVIAKEFRRLADQTASATLDIEKMISDMIKAVTEGVFGVDKFTNEIKTGVEQVSAVREQLTVIIEQVESQDRGFENVNQKMQGLALNADQINSSMEELSDTAGKTTQSIHQFTLAIEMLKNIAEEIRGLVATIKNIN